MNKNSHKVAALMVWAMTLCGVLQVSSISAQAATYYIAPSGSDATSGTATAPWKTWNYALKRLKPGDTLIVKDGVYNAAKDTGFPNIDCQAGYSSGTASQPITVRAENEREAHIANNGAAAFSSLLISNCAYWTFEGLHITNADFDNGTTDNGHVVRAAKSSNIILRRLLVAKPNRYRNAHAINLNATRDSLVEECEIYSFHRHGIIFSGHSDGNTARRNYLNSRSHADIAGGYRSVQSDQGDDCVVAYPATNSTIENNICEATYTGFKSIAASSEVRGNRLWGNIALNNEIGWSVGAQVPFSGTYPHDNVATDMVVINPTNVGVWLRDGQENTCRNCMVLESKAGGFIADYSSSNTPKAAFSVQFSNSLAWKHTGSGFLVKEHATWLLDHVNAYGGRTAFSPAPPTSNLHNAQTIDPQLGACKVWIPQNSPMKRAGKDGADIGANVLYRYVNGVLTSQPLWAPTTGAFPCGKVVPGMNSIAGSSCFDVHQRLHVNTSGCPLPSGYGAANHSPAVPAPINTHR